QVDRAGGKDAERDWLPAACDHARDVAHGPVAGRDADVRHPLADRRRLGGALGVVNLGAEPLERRGKRADALHLVAPGTGIGDDLDDGAHDSSRATATNSATLRVSARRCGSMPSRSRASTAPDKPLRLWRSISRRWPNAASVTFSSVRGETPSGCAAGSTWTTALITLGGGVKALRWTFIASLAVERHCASTARRPYALVPGAATMRWATSCWNISVRLVQRGGQACSCPFAPDSQPVNSAVPTL